MLYKKIAVLLITALALVSCGAGRSTVSSTKTSALHDELIDYGKKYIGKPYRYASRGPNSFDCSGFTSFVFKQFGYTLSPSSAGQDQQVPSIRRKQDLAKGDLVFFEGRSRNGRVGHVGIVTQVKANGDFDFIHASTSRGVIVSKSTEQYYASRYLRGGRVIDNAQLAAKRPARPSAQPVTKESRKRKPKEKENNAFTPATARKEPKTPNVPVIFPEKSEQEPIPVLANEKAEPISQKTEETVVLVQTDPLKNPQLENTDTTNRDVPENNVLLLVADTLFTLRNDSADVPEPVVQQAQETRAVQTHTVQPGETLYSISRKYNCSVEQLRRWNPQLGTTLKAGETLSIEL